MTPIKPGDCFFNVKRFSCLRVRTVGGKYADAVTWRPDGSKGSNLVKVRLGSLTKTPYWRMVATRVYTEHSSFEFELTDPAPIRPQIDQSPEEIEREVGR